MNLYLGLSFIINSLLPSPKQYTGIKEAEEKKAKFDEESEHITDVYITPIMNQLYKGDMKLLSKAEIKEGVVEGWATVRSLPFDTFFRKTPTA